jgi:Lrp/AsnC family transcriptional regulator for asnA, asnC and gidA
VLAETPEALFAIVNDQVRAVPGVVSVQTFDYHAIHTHRFIWGPR